MTRAWFRGGIVGGAALAACSFTHGSPFSGGDAMQPIDSPAICSSLGTSCSTDMTSVLTCSTVGQPPTSMACPWGCVPSGLAGACGSLVPTGGAVTGSDFVGSAMGSSLGSAMVDTDGGKINGSDWGWYRQTPTVGIFQFGTLHITGRITFTGNRAVAFVATGDITVDGVLDARGGMCNSGGADRGAGPGGFDGASAGGNGAGSGSGGQAIDDSGGGGGGGYGGAGGSGGYFMMASKAGAAGAFWGDAAISVLAGGGGGGAASDGNGGDGGGGGGAVQLVSNTTISIDATGGVDVGGCGGRAPNGTHGGGGGGAGGAIVLEAPTLVIAGQLAANGGGGGGGDSAGQTDGFAGSLGSAAAAGGLGHNASGDENGGSGGAGSAFVGQTAPHGGGHGGGGGGGVGRIRLNSRAGTTTTTLTGATISPDPAAANSPSTIAPAKVN